MAEQRKMTKEDLKRKWTSWRDRDAELVTGIFKNNEAPGQSTAFGYKMYPGEEIKDWFFQDGEKYTIPRGIARHLNTECYYKEYKHMPGETGQFGVRQGARDGHTPKQDDMMIMRKVHRYSFHSLEFGDDDLDMIPAPDIVEVTNSPKP
jgi:hypothetical protein